MLENMNITFGLY